LNMKYANREHAAENSELWRVSHDFWDEFKQLKEQFAILAQWAPHTGPGNWPDADMLQIGAIAKRGPVGKPRRSAFSAEEARTHITLWSIFRSPLMMGGNLPENTALETALMTNDEIISINQQSKNSRQVFRKDEMVCWASESLDGKYVNLALFNLNDVEKPISVDLSELDLKGTYIIRDAWKRTDIGKTKKELKYTIAPHASMMLRLIKTN
jgi:alpha-galactosidase